MVVHDLILTEVWKEKIFPELVDMDFEPRTTFPIYMVVRLLESSSAECSVVDIPVQKYNAFNLLFYI